MEFNGTFIVTIISFLVFVYLMNLILYKPILGIISERSKFIDDNNFVADSNKDKVSKILKDRDDQIQVARTEAKNIYVHKVDDFKSKKNSIVESAKLASAKELEEEYQNLNNISNEAKERLKAHMVDLANDIVEKMIGYRSEVSGFDNDAVNRILYH